MIVILIFLLAVYGLVISDNLIRKIMCLNILESMVVFLFLKTGYTQGFSAPIISDIAEHYVDPIPQALMLTAIVVGVCFNSLALSIIMKIYNKRGTIKVGELYEN
ncbi:MAG: cation:proton antiporter subunit C [Candidatus Muiribacteriota bacterium]